MIFSFNFSNKIIMSKQNQKTIYVENFIDEKTASNIYDYLANNTEWENGIPSKHGFTRLAKNMGDLDSFPFEIQAIIKSAIAKYYSTTVDLLGIYMNYYKDGSHFTPNHSHQGTDQLVLSFGATRTLTVGKKSFKLGNGDLILFGSSIHGIPKDPNVSTGRISIATFMKK